MLDEVENAMRLWAVFVGFGTLLEGIKYEMSISKVWLAASAHKKGP